jgi:hypothetical protein
MIRFAILPLLLSLAGTPQATAPNPADPPANDAAFVLPGDFAQSTSLADLEARFGKANVQVAAAGEGDIYHGVVLFPDDPTRRAYVEFYDTAPLGGVHAIWIRDSESIWRGKHGVHVGMRLAELRTTNAKPFYFNGFDGERRGWVHDAWSPALDGDDGSLGKLDVDEGEHMYFEVELGLRDGTPATDVPADEASVSSDDPRYPRLGEVAEVAAFGATTSLDDEWE